MCAWLAHFFPAFRHPAFAFYFFMFADFALWFLPEHFYLFETRW
jgi:hypothetical protein